MSKLKSPMLSLKKTEDILLFLVLLFLPTQLGLHFWPKFAYIYSLKIDYLSPTLYFWDLLVIGFLTVWFLQKPKINKVALNLLLLFLLTQLLSLQRAANAGAGLVRLEQYGLSGLFGVFLASAGSKDLLIKKVYLPLLIGILAEVALAVMQFIKGATVGLWILGERSFTISTPGIAKFDFQGIEVLRPYATFPHPNVLAGFMLISSLIMYQVLQKKLRAANLALFFTTITIFLTMSRAAILAGIISAAILLKKKWLYLATVLLIILSPILFTRFSSLLNFDNLTLQRREQLAVDAWQMFSKNPLFGIGLNNFIPTEASSLLTGPSRFLQPVHNIFLLALAETGITGLLGLVVLMGFPILKLIKLYPRRYILNPILPWVIILFLGMFDHYFLTLPQGHRLLFLIWGLTFSMVKLSSELFF